MNTRTTPPLVFNGRLLLAMTAMVLRLGSMGQCSIGSFGVQASCASQTPQADLVLSGGQPPYQLIFSASNGSVMSAEVAQSGTVGLSLDGSLAWPSPVTVTLTDALGCTAFAEAHYTMYLSLEPEVFMNYPCAPGAQLRWTGMFVQEFVSVPPPCPDQLYYEIVALQGAGIWQGLVADDWVQDLPDSWHFGTLLPLGDTYLVRIFPFGGACDGGNGIIYCPAAAQFSVEPEPVECGAQVRVRAALAGALSTGAIMSDVLRTSNLLPTTEPYTTMGYDHVGVPTAMTIAPGLLSIAGNNAVVDWVVLEWRDADNAAVVVHSQPALIQRDGDVMDLSGDIAIRTPLSSGRYHIALRHRNHLPIMTAGTVAMDLYPVITTIDLRLNSTPVHGTGARTQVNGVMCLWPGDTNFDGSARYTGLGNDRDPILTGIGGNVPTNVISGVYDARDVNLDGNLRYSGASNDRDIILQTLGGSVPTAVRVGQIP